METGERRGCHTPQRPVNLLYAPSLSCKGDQGIDQGPLQANTADGGHKTPTGSQQQQPQWTLGHLLQRLRHVTERPSAQSCSCHSAYTYFPASCTLDAQVVTFFSSFAVDSTTMTTAAHHQSRFGVSKERQ